MTTRPMIISLSEASDVSLVGGKAINLYRMMNAGLPVPEGFVVTTTAYCSLTNKTKMPEDVSSEIRKAYKDLGEPTVAVRSSATAEDMAEASMAGQYETFLDVKGADAVIESVEKCRQSLNTDRVRKYLAEQNIDASNVAVAVIIQKLVPADISGVLFTANPRTGASDEMVIEAVYGLGEGLVSGEVQPDIYNITSDNVDVQTAHKSKALYAGSHKYQSVPDEKTRKSCLTYAQIQELRKTGLQAQQAYGCPLDIEWAISSNKLYMLQARPVTTLAATQAYYALLQEAKTFLKSEISEGRGPWARHNLSETLPSPSPLTWSLIRSFMSGAGGFGLMHEHVGFTPSDTVKDSGFLTLIAGQIYMDLSRVTELFCADYPYSYDLELLRYNPDAAQQPPTIPNGTYKQLSQAGQLGRKVTESLHKTAITLDEDFDNTFVPSVNAWCREQEKLNLENMTDQELIDLWHKQQKEVLEDFGYMFFLPSMVEALAAADLKDFISQNLWDYEPDALLQKLSVSSTVDITLKANIELQKVSRGQHSFEQWLEDYGYRGPGEFDLASPRWNERQKDLQSIIEQLKDGPSVEDKHRQRINEARTCLKELQQQINASQAELLNKKTSVLQRYIRFREDGKAMFIKTLTQLRNTAQEFGRRLELDDAVFFLYENELPDTLLKGFVRHDFIEQRRQMLKAGKSITLPHVIEADDIPSLGQAQVNNQADSWSAFSVASGICSGPASIILDPTQVNDLPENYILVCPSTDPAWTPLFINASGLILERGGALSHGAIVAREMGLPSVVLENATKLFNNGEIISIDGNRGKVWRSEYTDSEVDSEVEYIAPSLRPPIIGKTEQFTNQLGLMAALFWGLLLGLMYIMPESWLRQPVYSLIDMLIWPVVRAVGMEWTVAITGSFFAIVPLLIQKYFGDNKRLYEAKKRAANLLKLSKKLDQKSSRRKNLLDYAKPVTIRTLKASMASLAWVLGPMMLIFLWMPLRFDPASWNVDAEGIVPVVIEIDGEYIKPVTCSVESPLKLEPTTPATQTLPPIRSTLEELKSEWLQADDLSSYPWQLQTAGQQAQEILLNSLNGFLSAGVPPQKISWIIRVDNAPNGSYPVTIHLHDKKKIQIMLTFGKKIPPTPNIIKGDCAPVYQVEALYQRPSQQRCFLAPLKAIGGPAWDFGWLGVYILSYLPVMLIVKKLLKIP